jgi:hypothetical protein
MLMYKSPPGEESFFNAYFLILIIPVTKITVQTILLPLHDLKE